MPVLHLALYDLVYHVRNVGFAWVRQRAHRRFTAVRKHHYDAFLGGGTRRVIAKVIGVDVRVKLLGLVVEVGYLRVAVMLRDYSAYKPGNSVLLQQRFRVALVRRDYADALLGRQVVMRIRGVSEVLPKEVRTLELAHVVIHGGVRRQARRSRLSPRRRSRQAVPPRHSDDRCRARRL